MPQRSTMMAAGQNIQVIRIAIVSHKGQDTIGLVTDKPDPRGVANNLVLSFNVAEGNGEQYVRTNFPGIFYEIIA